VKEVRLHSERGKVTLTGVVGIVTTMPCCDMGVTALSRRGYGRRALEALLCDGGSVEAASAPEP